MIVKKTKIEQNVKKKKNISIYKTVTLKIMFSATTELK